ATTPPKGSATKDDPQNSMPAPLPCPEQLRDRALVRAREPARGREVAPAARARERPSLPILSAGSWRRPPPTANKSFWPRSTSVASRKYAATGRSCATAGSTLTAESSSVFSRKGSVDLQNPRLRYPERVRFSLTTPARYAR